MPQLVDGIHHANPFVRQAARACLRLPRTRARWVATAKDYVATPPVLANSFPKSGTHLLDQIVAALPRGRNYGAFLSSMTSSFAFRERTRSSSRRFIESIVPGEIVRAHLFFDQEFASMLRRRHVIHYFIYRDLRDVVVSEAHYLRSMNRWHRLHPYFRRQSTIEDAVSLAIRGLPPSSHYDYPDVATRFRRFQGWLDSADVCAVRFEQLTSPAREATVQAMVEWYARRTGQDVDVSGVTQQALTSIDPVRSHTYRQGTSGSWRTTFTDRLHEEFQQVASDLSVDLVDA